MVRKVFYTFLYHKKFGFTLIEILIVLGIVAILSSLLVINITRSRMAVNENTAVNILVILRNAAISYYGSQTPSVFPGSFEDLTIPASNPPFVNLFLINAIKSQGVHRGYYYIYQNLERNEGFSIIARPSRYRTTGERSFLIDKHGRIFATHEDRIPNAQTDPCL